VAVKKVYIGSIGPLLYDDTDLIEDEDGDFSGVFQKGITTDGQVLVSEAPSEDEHVVRLTDIEGNLSRTAYSANTILKADTDETPVALTVPEQTVVGRITAGVITALTPSEVLTLLSNQGGLNIGGAENYVSIDSSGVITLLGTAKRKMTLRPSLDLAAVGQKEKPTIVTVGAYQGFSMPTWSTPVNADEELYFRSRVPYRWDGVSDIVFKVMVALAGAEDVGDSFKFQFSWETTSVTGAIAVTTNDVETEVEILAGRNNQYSTYSVAFTIDYDIDGVGFEILARNILAGRLRRIASGGTEVDNEIMVLDWVIEYYIDKLYGTW